MAKYKKPLSLAVINGTETEAPEIGIGEAPDYFNDIERSLWDELVSQAHHNTLGINDRVAFELLVRLMYEMRYAFEGMSSAKLSQLTNMLGRFGLTPADRQRVVSGKPSKKDNPFGKFRK